MWNLAVTLVLSLTSVGEWPPAFGSSRGGEVSSQRRRVSSPPGRPGKARKGVCSDLSPPQR